MFSPNNFQRLKAVDLGKNARSVSLIKRPPVKVLTRSKFLVQDKGQLHEQNIELKQVVSALQREKDHLKTQIVSLQEQLSFIQSGGLITQLRTTISALETELQKKDQEFHHLLAEKVKEKARLAATFESLEQKLDDAEQRVEKVQSRCEKQIQCLTQKLIEARKKPKAKCEQTQVDPFLLKATEGTAPMLLVRAFSDTTKQRRLSNLLLDTKIPISKPSELA